jgi:predicted NBD/HSP70 family sugar kinase
VKKILCIDIGGTHVKLLASDAGEERKFKSGRSLTPDALVSKAKSLAADWTYDAVSIGYPGLVLRGQMVSDPPHLAQGWVGFDFSQAFGCPVRIVNDAAMQALGSYQGGRMLFLGLGTGLGAAMIVDGRMEPMELGHLPYRRGLAYEDYVGIAGLKRMGEKKWRKHVWAVVELWRLALAPDTVVLGGGNAALLSQVPEGVRIGNNAAAFKGGFQLWD